MRVRIWLGILLVLAVAGIVGVPWLVRWQTINTLEQMLGQEVAIRDLSFNPFVGRAWLGGITIGNDTSIEAIEVAVALFPLLDRRLQVENLAVAGVHVPVELDDDGLSVARYRLRDDDNAEEPGEPGEPWSFAVDEGATTDIVVALTIDGLSVELTVHEATVANLAPGESSTYRFDVAVDGASVSGTGVLKIDANGTTVDGELSLGSLSIEQYRPLIGVDVEGTIDAEGRHHVELGEDVAVSFDGTVGVGDLDLVSIAGSTVEDLSWEGEARVRLAEGRESDFNVTGDVVAQAISNDPFGSMRRLEISALDAGPGRFTAGSVVVDGVDVLLRRDDSGHLASLPETGADADLDADASSSPFEVLVAEIDIRNGSLRFIDESVEPTVRLAFADFRAHASNLGSGRSMSYRMSAVRADAADAEDAPPALTSEGEVALLQSPIAGDLTLSLSQFELHEVGAYVGGGIRSGRLRLNSTVEIREGVIDAANHVRIDGIKVDQATAEDSQEMPLSLALSMLKDSDGNIELDVPVNASVEKFTIGTDDIVQTALKNAARTAALTYAKFALQPFGTLMLLKGVADKIARPQFEPILFGPREVELDADADAYAKKLAELLKARPALSLTVCGYATDLDELPEDAAAEASEQDELRALAEARGRAVRDAIRSAGVESERLYSCAPLVLDSDEEPYVELKL